MKAEQKAVAREFDKYVDRYSQTVNDALIIPGLDVDYFTRVKAGYIVDLAKAQFGDTRALRILDVGCGVGNFHGLLAGQFGSITGVDVSAESIEQAQRRHPANAYVAYDGERLPFEDGSFDVAYAVCVMHHVPVPMWPNFAAEMRRILRPGGLGMVFEHNPYNPLTRRIVDRCPFDADAVLLKPGKTAALLAEAGFSGLRTRSIISIPSVGPRSRRFDELLGMMPLGAQYYVKGTNL